MKNRLERRYGQNDLHFITCSCHERKPLVGTKHSRDIFLAILSEVRARYDFGLWGYVVMPEHIHLLISEPRIGTPTTVMQALKQRVSRAILGEDSKRKPKLGKLDSPGDVLPAKPRLFWQPRFYDFNVWSSKKRNEKLNYMHFNPVKRGLVENPKDWLWSSCSFYGTGKASACPPNPKWKLTAKA